MKTKKIKNLTFKRESVANLSKNTKYQISGGRTTETIRWEDGCTSLISGCFTSCNPV